MSKTALVAGATGLVGRLLLQGLLAHPAYGEVRALTRRALDIGSPRLKTLITDYAGLDALGSELAVDEVFCCLGTTLRKAGSRAAFERVDHGMVLDLARATRAAGARSLLVVSAVGSSEHSPSFYSRVKARMEQDVSALGFDTVQILRPSLLLGTREESRPAEELSQRLSPVLAPLLRGRLARYRPVRGSAVAEALVTLAQRAERGVHVHHLPLD